MASTLTHVILDNQHHVYQFPGKPIKIVNRIQNSGSASLSLGSALRGPPDSEASAFGSVTLERKTAMDGIERFTGPGGRHYKLWVQRDLFGELVIMRAWGGEKSGRAGFKSLSTTSEADCEKLLHRIRNRRRQRGYVPIPTRSSTVRQNSFTDSK